MVAQPQGQARFHVSIKERAGYNPPDGRLADQSTRGTRVTAPRRATQNFPVSDRGRAEDRPGSDDGVVGRMDN